MTTEHFKQKVFELVNNEYEVVGEYMGSVKAKTLFKHKVCNTSFEMFANNFVDQGQRCPKCAGNERKTTQRFISEFQMLVEEEFKVIGEYTASANSIEIKHEKCGHIFERTARRLLKEEVICPVCKSENFNEYLLEKGLTHIKPRKTQSEFEEEIVAIYNNEYKVLEKYKNMRTYILVEHATCNSTFKVRPDIILNGKFRCKVCKVNEKLKELKDTVFKLYRNEFEVIGEEIIKEKINSKDSLYYSYKILIQHKVCGTENYIDLSTLHQGNMGCLKCYGNEKKNTEGFRKEVFELEGNDYSILSEYDNSRTKVLIKHNKCGFEYTVTPHDFLSSGNRCPRCRESRGEKETAKVLEKLNISYERQYKIDECKNEKHLPFDFALFIDQKLIGLIEYHGRQHYEPVESFGGEKEFLLVQMRDNIKMDFCKSNLIPLIVIPYWELNTIETFLNKELDKIV